MAEVLIKQSSSASTIPQGARQVVQTVQVASGPGGGAAGLVTQDLTIPVDYVAGTTDPPERSFLDQADVDNFVNANGSVRHIEAAVRALGIVPAGVTVTINLAAGTHLPQAAGRADFSSWDFSSILNLGTVTIAGQPVASWTVQSGLTGLAIASATANSITSTGSFTGFDLRGLMALVSDGQFAVIESNDNDTITFNKTLSPVPTAGVDTVGVVRPSTLLRNSLDDITTANLIAMRLFSPNSRGQWNLDDVGFEFGGDLAQSVMSISHATLTLNRVLDDRDVAGLPAGASDGRGITLLDQANTLFMNDCSFRALTANGKAQADFPIDMGSGEQTTGNITAANCYWGGAQTGKPLHINAPEASLRLTNCTIDEQQLEVQGMLGSEGSTIRNPPASRPALEMWNRGRSLQLGVGLQWDITIGGTTGAPAVLLRDGASIEQKIDFLQEAGNANTDVGVEVSGAFTRAQLSSATDVVGDVGNTRIGGTLRTYASLPDKANPINLANFNLVSKEP